MKTNRWALLFLLSLVLMAPSISCTGNQDMLQEEEKNDAKVHLSFALKNAAYAPEANTRGATRGEVTTGEEDGTDAEQRVNNMWVLLFSKGADDAASLLKYRFSFTPGSAMTDNYEEPEGVFIHNNIFYITSTKLVKPGIYRAVMVVNTKQYVTSYPTGSGTQYNNVQDVMALFNTPAITNYAELKERSQNMLFDINDMPRCDKSLESQSPAQGVFSYYVDDAFEVKTGYTSPHNPLQKEIDLKRWLSKVRVLISNVDAVGNVIPSSVGYTLENVALGNYFPQNKLFEWNTHGYGTETGYNTDNLVLNPEFLGVFPLLNEMKSNETTSDKKIIHQELFNHYITAYNNELIKQDADNNTYVFLTFKHTQTQTEYQYKIPLFGVETAPSPMPDYVTDANFTKYTILRNTLYELDLTFKGKFLESTTGLKVLPWKEKTINDDNFIDYVI